MESSTVVNYTDSQKKALIQSATTLLLNKVKLVLANPKKNRQLASNQHLLSIVEILAEQIIPQYFVQNYKNSQKIQTMHSLCYLLASKVQAVYNSGVIRTCIDQNWDMKGYKSVLIRILVETGLTAQEDTKKLQEFFDKLIQSQNLQSQSCIKAISQFLRNKNRSNIDEDDLKNPIVSFQTSFEFVRDEIVKFREQNMNHTCFTVLHPWAYDLELVDFKYVINKDQTQKIVDTLASSLHAQLLWLSYFKSQLSVSADEFFSALREVALMSDCLEKYEASFDSYHKFMIKSGFVISLEHHSTDICRFVNALTAHQKVNIMKSQVKLSNETRVKSGYIDESILAKNFEVHSAPTSIGSLKELLHDVDLLQLSEEQAKRKVDMQRQVIRIKPIAKQSYNIVLKFTNVDTEELKDLEIKFDGNLAQFKVGEGDGNHYVICNDKKLWESQFMILNQNGKFFIRDLGIVHTSRIKVNPQTQLQIHQGSLLDLGKVVHYHVDKLLHERVPAQESTPNFIVMNSSQSNYKVDDEAMLRARPTWISADENKDLVQNEIILEATPQKSVFSVGRSNRRDVEIKLKAVSADHCKIEYKKELGWFIHEKDKERLSSNGTFVFMKSLTQMDDHEPSDLIPLFNGMTVSFINYELQVRIEPKTSDELSKTVFEEIDLGHQSDYAQEQNTPSHKSVASHDSGHEEKTSTKQHQEHIVHSDSQKSLGQKSNSKHSAGGVSEHYNEDFQSTHQQKNNHQLVEDFKKASGSSSSHHQSVHEDQVSQHSQHQSVVGGKSVASSVKDANQSVHEDDHISDQKSLHKTPSQQSVRQSQHSARSSVGGAGQQESQHSQLQDDHEVRKSVQSVHSSQKASLNQQEEEKSLHQQEESPKHSQHSQPNNQDDDEPHQDMRRSFSQHHIGEVYDSASQKHNQSQLVHSDDEEENKQASSQHHEEHKQSEHYYSQPEEEAKSQAQYNSQPVDDDVKSQKSLKQGSQQHYDTQPKHDQVNQSQASIHDAQDDPKVQSQASLKSDRQSYKPPAQDDVKSVHSVHQDSHRSVHSVKQQDQQQPDDHQSEAEKISQSQHSIHQSVHEDHKSVHDDNINNQSLAHQSSQKSLKDLNNSQFQSNIPSAQDQEQHQSIHKQDTEKHSTAGHNDSHPQSVHHDSHRSVQQQHQQQEVELDKKSVTSQHYQQDNDAQSQHDDQQSAHHDKEDVTSKQNQSVHEEERKSQVSHRQEDVHNSSHHSIQNASNAYNSHNTNPAHDDQVSQKSVHQEEQKSHHNSAHQVKEDEERPNDQDSHQVHDSQHHSVSDHGNHNSQHQFDQSHDQQQHLDTPKQDGNNDGDQE